MVVGEEEEVSSPKDQPLPPFVVKGSAPPRRKRVKRRARRHQRVREAFGCHKDEVGPDWVWNEVRT